MSIAGVDNIVTDLGILAAAIGAILGTLALIARTKPCRWLWRRLISEPMGTWFRSQVAHEIEPRIADLRAELRPNGGHSFFDVTKRRLDRHDRLLRQICERLGITPEDGDG